MSASLPAHLRPRRRRKWRNHTGNQEVDPLVVCTPQSLEDLVLLVRRATEEGVTVRAVGSGHSWSDVALGSGYLLKPDGLRRPLPLEEELLKPEGERPRHLARVEAGMTIRGLNAHLDRRGLALPNMGGYDGQTVGGVISTSTHGSGLSLGPLNDLVRSLDLVAAGGAVYRIEPHGGPTDREAWEGRHPDRRLVKDDRWFRAAAVGMGCLGLVYAATLEAQPSYLLTEVRTRSTWERVREDLEAGEALGRHRHYELYLNPHPGRDGEHLCMVTTRSPTERLPPWWSSRRRRNLVAEGLSRLPGIGRLIDLVATAAPGLTPRLMDMALRGLTDDEYTGKSYRVLNIGAANFVPAYSAEIGVPVDDRGTHVEAVERILEIAARRRELGRVYHTSPIALRFVKASDAYMSMMQGRDTMMIELIQLKRTEGGYELLAAYEDALYELGGRPHWGQVNTLTGSDGLVGQLYPELPKWLDVHAELNADGVFDSPFSKRVGIAAPAPERAGAGGR